jgi:membrane associated rhomboid family serine protease
MSDSQPALNVPRVVTGVAALLTAVQAVKSLLPDEAKITFILALAFIPARYSGAAPELPGGYLTAVTSFVTYMMVHGGWVHLAVNLLWMLAFGSAVARRMSGLAFVSFSVLCGIAGAFTHLLFHFGDMTPVIGAFAGQMAGAEILQREASSAASRISPGHRSLGQTLSDKRMLAVLAIWIALNAYFGISAVQIGGEEGNIAWEAHIGGFLCGLLIFGAFDAGRRRGDGPAVGGGP